MQSLYSPTTTCPRPNSVLSAVDLEPITQLAERLVASWAGRGAEDKLGVELPGLGHAPGLLDASIDQRVVVLQVGTQALGHQGGPGDVLGHAVGVDSPDGELVGVERELVLHALDDGFVDEEKHLGVVCQYHEQ